MLILNFNKKQYKPPFEWFNHGLKAILLLQCLIQCHATQINGSQEQYDDIVVEVESTPYSLKFSLADPINFQLESVICKSIKHEEIAANADFVCENLIPCYNYLSVLTIHNKTNGHTFEKTHDTRTAYIAPQTSITSIESFTDSINLTWTTTDRNCVSSYAVIAKAPGKTHSNDLLNDRSYFLFENLDPCQEYLINLTMFDNNSLLISSEHELSTTKYAEPGKISLNIENLDNADTKISWNPPKHNTCIRYYLLKWYALSCWDKNLSENENCIESKNLTDPGTNQYKLSNLQGCEMYNLKIYINEIEQRKGERNFQSAEQMPSGVQEQDWNVTDTAIRINWGKPREHSKCVDFYWICVSGPLQRETYNKIIEKTNETFIDFNNLDPCGNYNVEIIPQSWNTSIGPVTSGAFNTLETQPSPIIDATVLAEAYALTLSWVTPIFADLCITGYNLTGWRDDNVTVSALSATTTQTNISYNKGLNACQAYTVQIVPTTKTLSGEKTYIDVEMGAAIVDAEKTTLQVVAKYSHSLELSAQSTDFNNTCQTVFAHFVCATTESVPHKYAEKYVEGHVGDISFKALLAPLSPYTDFECSVVLYNIAGASLAKKMIQKTDTYFPESPEQLTLSSRTAHSLTIQWHLPKYPNGNVKLYVIYFQRYEANYFVPPDCDAINVEPSSLQTGSTEYNFTNLLPDTKYSVQVAAQNEYGIGQFTEPKIYITLPSTSDPINNLRLKTVGPYASDEFYMSSVLVSWLLPCKSNGKIEYFLLDFVGERINAERVNYQRILEPKYDVLGVMEHNETDLLPEYNYTVTVEVKTYYVDTKSIIVQGAFDAPAGIPKRLNESIIAKSRITTYDTNHPTSTAIVRIPAAVMESEFGSILYVALLLSQKGCAIMPPLVYEALNSHSDWPDIPAWHEAYNTNNACIEQYQTTPLRWTPTPIKAKKNRYRRDLESEIVYTIGTDKCEDHSLRYCNGPLKAETEYYAVIRLFTKSGYNDVALLEFRTDSAIKVVLILVSVSSCLLMAFIVGLAVLYVKKRIAWHRDSGQGIEDPFGNIMVRNFAIFYKEISKPEKIAREFKELTVVALDLSYSASELGCHKNRYADIYPYDKNRVILDIDAEGSDYINASFIDGYTRKKEYIATQGPKPETTMDFWRMVLQHNVRIIVMVTQYREGNQVKCHEYFPYSNKGIDVVIKNKETFDIYDRTEMTVTHDKYGLKQKVVHFYFKKWPDHGCPEDPMYLINFVRKIKSEKRPRYSPIVVHCSAGVGRTGTFIGLDIIIQRMKSESKINIFETVKKLRFQRMKMVQTLEQYTILYICTYELVKHKIPRRALKMERKTSKKVSFEDGKDDTNTTANDSYTLTLRKSNDLESLHELPDIERHGIKHDETET